MPLAGFTASLSPSPSQAGLRLQIPSTQGFSFSSPNDGFSPSAASDYNPNIIFSHTSSPVDYPSPGGNHPPWGTPTSAGDISPYTHQNPSGYVEFPISDTMLGGSNSFPLAAPSSSETGQEQFSISDINFLLFNEPTSTGNENDFQDHGHGNISDIPTIEVTSYDPSSFPSSPTVNSSNCPMPELSVGSWSGPSSPSFTAYNGNEDFLSEFSFSSTPRSRTHSRRSSMTFSDRGDFNWGDEGGGGLKPTQNFHSRRSSVASSHSGELHWGDEAGGLKPVSEIERLLSTSRPRSRSDIFPQSRISRYTYPPPTSRGT
jgi:hypothetical protein